MGEDMVISGKRALYMGRFQPFHMGHFRVLQEIIQEAKYVVLAIGSAKKSYTKRDPFTAGERILMIRNSLPADWHAKCYIVPVDDIGRYNVWVAHVEDQVPPFDLVVGNSALTAMLFSEKGYEIYRPREYSRSVLKGEEIRKRMSEGKPWENLVPEGAAKVIKEIGGADRLKKIRPGNNIGSGLQE